VLADRGRERRLVELAAVEGLGADSDYVLTPAVDRASEEERA
jgi:type IV secretion system protein VirB11